jgi:hypothetical protein
MEIMSSAHPMLQPVDWSIEPSQIKDSVSSERYEIYKLIWDCAIACTMRAPLYDCYRYTLQDSTNPLAIASRKYNEIRVGYCFGRSDEPLTKYPLNEKIEGTKFEVVKAWTVPIGQLSLGKLIYEMKENGVATAATVASRLKKLLEESPIHLKLMEQSKDLPGHRWTVELTEKGRSDLGIWEKSELLADTKLIRKSLINIEDGKLSVYDALKAIVPNADIDLIDKLSKDIENTCKLWKGTARQIGNEATRKAEIKAPKLIGLPFDIDPEFILENESVLRIARVRMEQELAMTNINWFVLSDVERMVLRKEWLRNYLFTLSVEDKIQWPDPDATNARFDTLLAWFVCGFAKKSQ